MSRSVMLLCLLAGVAATFIARALGVESLISQLATAFVVFLLLFGGFRWTSKSKAK